MYDGLSKDPNSLANLDQDLPNYAQANVPIFSLPQASAQRVVVSARSREGAAPHVGPATNPSRFP